MLRNEDETGEWGRGPASVGFNVSTLPSVYTPAVLPLAFETEQWPECLRTSSSHQTPLDTSGSRASQALCLGRQSLLQCTSDVEISSPACPFPPFCSTATETILFVAPLKVEGRAGGRNERLRNQLASLSVYLLVARFGIF